MNIVRGDEQVSSATETGRRLGQQVGPVVQQAHQRTAAIGRRANELVGTGAQQTARGLRAAADVVETRSWGRWLIVGVGIVAILVAIYTFGGNNAPSWMFFIPREGTASALERSGGWWMGPVVSGERISMTNFRYSHWGTDGPVFTDLTGKEVVASRQTNDTGAFRWHLEGTPYYFLRDAKGVAYIASDPNAW